MSESVCATSEVLVHFTLSLTDGTLADSSRQQGKPALFRLSDGSLSPALQQQLIGLRPGDKKSFTLPPHAAFGPLNPDLIHYFNRREFTATGELTPGMVILFRGVNGNEMPGIVQEINGESVTVDFNHPLAGQHIHFELEILAVDPQPEALNAHLTG